MHDHKDSLTLVFISINTQCLKVCHVLYLNAHFFFVYTAMLYGTGKNFWCKVNSLDKWII